MTGSGEKLTSQSGRDAKVNFMIDIHGHLLGIFVVDGEVGQFVYIGRVEVGACRGAETEANLRTGIEKESAAASEIDVSQQGYLQVIDGA